MRPFALAFGSGILYFLAFPTFNLWPLAWVFCLPLLFAVENKRPPKAFLLGMVSGLVAWGGVLYWIALVMNTYGGLNMAASLALLVLLVAYLALSFGVFAAAASFAARSGLGVFVLAGIWTGLELARSYLVFGGFPWALLGHSQLSFLLLAQIAELGGVFLISAVVMAGNIALYQLLRGRKAPAAVIACVVLVCCAFGWARLETPFQGTPMKVGVAQANVPQDQKWKPERTERVLSTYLGLTRRALDGGARLVVWPETACTFYLFRHWPYTQKVLDLSEKTDADLLVGSPAYEDGCILNRAYLLRRGRIEGVYDKVHLVPFGEYLPFASLLRRYFGSLTAEVGDFCPGEGIHSIGEIGVSICFESVFPGISRGLVKDGAKILVNISNDAWFKTWSTPEQHLQQACFRAIETRRFLVRSVNHGISALIDPGGRIVRRIGLLEEGVIVEDAVLLDGMTFHTRAGPLLPLVWAAISVILGGMKLTRGLPGGKAFGP